MVGLEGGNKILRGKIGILRGKYAALPNCGDFVKIFTKPPPALDKFFWLC